jgi:putative ABC transport system permease protein
MHCSTSHVHHAGEPVSETPALVGRHYVGPDHFETLEIPLLRGRALTAADRAGGQHVAVINETAARLLWPGDDPIGRRVWFTSGGGFASPDSLTEIVGIVGDVLYAAPGETVGADFYTSYLQFTWPAGLILVRADGDPLALVPALRHAVAEIDPNVPLDDIRTMSGRAADALSDERFATGALGAFAGIGLLLAVLGVYGIMAYSVAQRRREIGIRVALGASRREIVRFVLGQGAALVVPGLVLGVAMALALSRVLGALIESVDRPDLLVLAAVAGLLLLVAFLAAGLPARTAAHIDPIETLGAE